MSHTGIPMDLLRLAVEGTELTKREREVLRLRALGRTGPATAKELGISYETVRTHARNARARLGAKTTAEAVAVALSLDLI